MSKIQTADIEEMPERKGPVVSMRVKMACVGAAYLTFLGCVCILGIDHLHPTLVQMIGPVNEEAPQEEADDPQTGVEHASSLRNNAKGPTELSLQKQINASQGNQTVIQLGIDWVFNTSAVFEGKRFGAGHQGCQTVWDVDDDGTNEVVFGTRRGDSERMWCVDGEGIFEWVYPPIEEEGLINDPTSKVSLVDVDADGRYEICFAGMGGRLHVLNGDGTVLWTWDNPIPPRHDLPPAMDGAPQAHDVDGDGFPEFFMNDNLGYAHRVAHDGELVWTTPLGDSLLGHPTICDLEQDGEYETLWTCLGHQVFCLDAGTGEQKWTYELGSSIKFQPVIVADVNQDGEYEILAWSDAPLGGVVCLNHLGQEIWTWKDPYNGNIRMCQAMGDVDGDGSMDMAIMTSAAAFCVDIGGETPETKWEVNFSRWSEDELIPRGAVNNHWSSYQLIADIDGDGQQEILWLSPYPIVTDAATGALEAYYTNFHLAVDRRQENGGWWGDVDQDGVSEWIVELNGNSHPETQVYCLTMNGSFPAPSPWPEYSHCAYPAEYQNQQDWITLKSAGSNSLWFPLELEIGMIMAIQITLILIGKRFL